MSARRHSHQGKAAAQCARLVTCLVLPYSVFCTTVAPVAAQSTDPHRPTVLGPHLNRGNITNDVRGHYYTFVVGPGHVDVELAFKERGFFGHPFRQHINFDFWRPDGTLAKHRELESVGKLARLHVSADLPTRQRFNLAVTTQWGAIKVGGYYEIELKGAVEDAGQVGAKVRPQTDPSLLNP